GTDMKSGHWFMGAELNFAENLLMNGADQDPAIIFRDERGRRTSWTYDALRRAVGSLRQWMHTQGIRKGDRVAGYLPNIPETVIAMLATTALGAIWSSTSPDFGERGVIDRFGQIQPKLLFTVDGYTYKKKPIHTHTRIAPLLSAIPSIKNVVLIEDLDSAFNVKQIPKAQSWSAILEHTPSQLEFTPTSFEHPIYILYSSGTTGVPKCIVHGAGGTLLQHIKEHRLHTDLHPQDRFFYFTTCGWMMWNWLVSGLASQATLMLYEGSPFFPSEYTLWSFVEQERIKIFGTSAKYLAALEKTGLKPRIDCDLHALQTILSTGSPLSAASFEYVYRDIKSDVHLASIAGGTDIVSCFMLGNPMSPVYGEELQGPGLGMDVQVWSPEGQPLPSQHKGELVCATAFPCQPVGFWDDPAQEKYHRAYFDVFPNVWRHGDLIEQTVHGGFKIYGRSDATLNPGGVRIGTAEIYRAVEPLSEIQDSLVIGHQLEDDVEIVLFVKMRAPSTLTPELIAHIQKTIRQQTTPRHVPAKIFAIADIPYTISGKKVEIAVRNILHGQEAPNQDALANPQALDLFRAFQL
ncbi:MAG: acetoacetate--CoA ligase, partial [Myxococcota bacterium]